MNILLEIKNTAAGAAIISDWLGAGGVPVADKLADYRGEVCEGCPENGHVGWWNTAKQAVASRIKEHLSVKHRLGFRVHNEEKLGMCKTCGCCNPLAVWVPIQHIKAHTHSDTLMAYPSNCWKKIEINDDK